MKMYLCHSVWVSLWGDSVRITGQFSLENPSGYVPVPFYNKEIKLFRTATLSAIDKIIHSEFLGKSIEHREWITSDTVYVCFCRSNGELILRKTYQEFKDSYRYMLDLKDWKF